MFQIRPAFDLDTFKEKLVYNIYVLLLIQVKYNFKRWPVL